MKKIVIVARQLGATLLLATNSVVHIAPLLVVALIKLIVRLPAITRWADRLLMALAASWIDVNSWMMDHLTTTKVEVTGWPESATESLANGHYLLIANHRSWVDIPVLQKVFNRRLPMLRFFLKSQLIWVPILGLAWWALEFPFMKRYSRAQIEKRPELAGKDLVTTKKACEKFKTIPVTIVNFVEGTRFNQAKRREQESAYQQLLKPRAGGTAFVLDAMGEQLDTLVDVTIHYPQGGGELLDLFANRIPTVHVHLDFIPIPDHLKGGDYQQDDQHRANIQAWLNALWSAKDARLQGCPLNGRV